jgi:hypothetical protein
MSGNASPCGEYGRRGMHSGIAGTCDNRTSLKCGSRKEDPAGSGAQEIHAIIGSGAGTPRVSGAGGRLEIAESYLSGQRAIAYLQDYP